MIQKTVSVGPLQCNCQILVCAKTLSAVIVDPGDEADKILRNIHQIESELSGQKISVKALLHTHAHFDHMGATREVATKLKASGVDAPTIFLHRGDEFIYQMLKRQGEMFGFQFEAPLPVDRFLNDNEELTFGTLRFQIIHTPGHSPGGVCFRLHSDSAEKVPETVFSGDTLFRRSIGRSDLWGGDQDLLMKSIRERLFVLDGDTAVHPGHGPSTRIGEEKLENPYAS
jgi:glyoxylase-like metal-dependent hydrolase (beta-lactamase superfamily II)